MKKLGIWLFIAFILIAGAYAVMQSNIGRNLVRSVLSNALEQSGFEIEIGHIEGTLPHQIELKEISIKGNGVEVAIAELKLRPVLWRLFKKEAAFTGIRAKGISIGKTPPFDFKGKFRLNAKRATLSGTLFDWTLSVRFDRKQKFAQFVAQHPLLNVKGTASFDKESRLIASNLQIGSNQILSKLPFDASGTILANLFVLREGAAYRARIGWQIPYLTVEQTAIGEMKGMGEAVWQDRTLKGHLTAEPSAKTTFDLALDPNAHLTGTTEFEVENIQSLHIPNLYGKLFAKAEWESVNAIQLLHLDATATDFYYGSFFARKASLYSDLTDPFKNLTGLFDIEVEKAKWNDLELETASFETEIGEEECPFRLFADGKWKHPLEIHMAGSWKDRLIADIQSFTGIFYNRPFALAYPVHFEWSDQLFRLPNVEITTAESAVFLHIERQGNQTEANLRFDRLPLDFLSLNPFEGATGGRIDLQASVQEKNNRLHGTLKAAIDQMEIASFGSSETTDAAGRVEGQFNRDLLSLKGNFLANEKPILNFDLDVPIHFSIWPFEATPLTHETAKGKISMDGRIEDFLDFFDLGPHRLEGQCHCNLRFTNTLYRPLIEGTLQFREGSYQNYYTGTELQNISADFLAEKNILYLQTLTAQDAPGTGSLKASGEIRLLQSDQYPFRIDADFQNLKFVEIDLVQAAADGKIHIEGNALSAIARGEVHMIETQFTIPDHIPRPPPNLQVVYRNPIHPILPPQTEYRPYPLSLDLHVTAPKAISISGRGLNSEWKGNFHLGGTYTAPAAQGKLELIAGEFNFSSRSFRLTDGSLSLSGREHEMPNLNLAGSMETKGILITARIKGPLDDPQITFQSVPPLPLGSIMSYLLFGQDISEISGFQALQLATSLASLAGTGPDIMESTRRSLGVDRLRVITDPTEEGGETVALQVGKYVSKGILVSFTQGTEESSTNISVEVELKGNFVFQIESDQHQEQGKFTLKWSKNY